MPMPLLAELEDRKLADLSALSRGLVILDPRVSGVPLGTPLPLAPAQYDPAGRLAAMDQLGLSHHVVSLPPFLFCTTMPDRNLALEIVRRGNDELAAYVDSDPGRLLALGPVPVGLVEAADEAQRCLDVLGTAGVAIGTFGAGLELDDSVNEDLYRFLAHRGTFTFLHPSGIPGPERVRDYWLPQLIGYPTETALAVARVIFGGVLDRHPLILCLAHGGGCLPALRGRLDLGWRRKEAAHTTNRLPSEQLDTLYYDTAVFSTLQLRRLIDDVGSGHVMVGTDYPDLVDRDPIGTVKAVGLEAPDEQRVLFGTAKRLLGHDRFGDSAIE